MTNAVEVLFGFAAAGLVGGVLFQLMKRPAHSRKMFSFGFAALILAIIGEVVLRVMP